MAETANKIRARRRARRRRLQFEGTRAECEAIIAEENRRRGYPRPGTPIGPGPHENQTWDGTGSPPPGWTVSYAEPEEKHDEPGKFACYVRSATMRDRLLGTRLAKAGTIRVRNRDAWKRPEDEEPSE